MLSGSRSNDAAVAETAAGAEMPYVDDYSVGLICLSELPPRSEEVWSCYVESWKPILEKGGAAIGAFVGDALVGIAVLHLHLTKNMAQLAALFASKDYRRLHVAQRLTEEAVRLARQSGASAFYVSATPSESAIGFYRSQGFEPTAQVNKELYELEPEDIHMVKLQ